MKRIAIHSVPRSGSTWLGEIFNSNEQVLYKYQPLFSYAFKGRLSDNSGLNEINDFFEDLAITEDDFLDQEMQRQNGSLPIFQKDNDFYFLVYKEVRYHHILENFLEKDKNLILIALVRNPLAVLSSWFNAPREFRQDLGWKIKKEWRFGEKKNEGRPEEFFGFEKWKEATQIFSSLKTQYPNRVYLLDYNTLLADTVGCVNNLFEFCGIEMTSQTKQFLLESRNSTALDTYSVFKQKNKDDSWYGKLDADIVNTIKKEVEGTELERYL